MIFKFSIRILRKEKAKLFLPFVSILIATIIASLTFVLISSSSNYLQDKSKELTGGDISIRSVRDFDIYKYIDKQYIYDISNQTNFNGVLNYKENGIVVDFTFVDYKFPLYGDIQLSTGDYEYLDYNQIYIDKTLQSKYNINIDDQIIFNNKSFIVKGVITNNPENLISGSSFYPKVLLSSEAIDYSQIDLSLFRKDYKKKIILNNSLSKEYTNSLKENLKNDGLSATFADQDISDRYGIDIVKKFIFIIVIIVSILSVINIYSSVNFLVDRLRRIFAILLALGIEKSKIYSILLYINTFIIVIAGACGMVMSYYMSNKILFYIKDNFNINIIFNFSIYYNLIIFFIIYITSIFAIIPILNKIKNINPKELLSNNIKNNTKISIFAKDIILSMIPIMFICIYIFDSVFIGTLIIIGIIFFYSISMYIYKFCINLLYKNRDKFNFAFRMLLAQKKSDGALGIITFTSLFFALMCLYTMSLLRNNIEQYLNNNIKNTVPSIYVLDLQGSQVESFINKYRAATLFPNIRARITNIDDLDVQKALEDKDSDINRELRREFNLTYLESLDNFKDTIIKGDVTDITNIKSGEVSIEKDFAKSINVDMGSTLIFNIQGFDITAKVTSIREVDKISGTPFFFFIFSKDQLQQFPATFFGYVNIDKLLLKDFYRDIANNFSNVSVIDTSLAVDIFRNIIQTFVIIILLISLPPILLSVLLIVNIVSSLSKDRKRDGARLMALGKTISFVRNYFIVEASVTVILSSISAYLLSILIANIVSIYFLNINNIIFVDIFSIYIFLIIFCAIIVLGIALWFNDKKNIKDYLNQQDNS